jgi:hypothetical protein
MNVGKFAVRVSCSLIGAFVLIINSQTGTLAQHDQGHSAGTMQKEDKDRTSALVKAVREATRRFQDPNVAMSENYFPQFGCVSGSSEGAMGVHFVNDALVANPEVDLAKPELLVYEPLPGGRFQLVAADYLVTSQQWFENNQAPPQLQGQLFHLFEAPNRFGLPEFFTLHVWAWKENPQGTFANWNPNVSCDAYNPQVP